MDLSSLNTTLPQGLAEAERDMGDKFRAAATSMTNLYKSSLAYSKQAYHVGYAAALADVLSTVQSSIASGQDGAQTLGRLMDWAEAREAAMAAFAAEEETDIIPPPQRLASLTRQALDAHLSKPSPPTIQAAPIHALDNSPDASSSGSQLVFRRPHHLASSTPVSADTTFVEHSTPSSPISAQHQARPMVNRSKASQSPVRMLPHRAASSLAEGSSSRLTSAEFNPVLPSGLPNLTVNDPSAIYPTGAKRPHALDMEVEEPSTPLRVKSKRRNMGGREDIAEDKERERRDGGPGGGGGAAGRRGRSRHGAAAGA